MFVPTIYNSNPYIWMWVENYYNQLPLWRKIIMKFGCKKITQEEFEIWLINKDKK